VRQGVTTEIVGNCGVSLAPVSPHSLAAVTKLLRSYAYDGEVGILTGHAPMMALLGKGVLKLGGGQSFNVEGGFLQVVDNTVRVVTEKASAA